MLRKNCIGTYTLYLIPGVLELLLFFSNSEGRGKLVRFSFEPDLSQGECHRLLKKSWADFDIHPKVTQKLFIR